MVTKRYWLGAIAIAVSIHVAAFISLPALIEKSTSKDKGETGIEIDLGMLGDLGVAIAETVEDKVEEQPEPIKEAVVEPESVEVEQPPKPEPIIKPIETKTKRVVPKEVIKIKKQTPKKKKVKKEVKKVTPTKAKPKVEASTQPKKQATATKAKKSKTAAKKITTGSQNSVSTGGNKAAKQSYIGVLAAKLARYKRYPNSARRRQQEGTATLFFVVRRDGTIKESYISESSGHAKLDQAVLKMLKKASPLPAFPDDMKESELTIRIPIEFKLK